MNGDMMGELFYNRELGKIKEDYLNQANKWHDYPLDWMGKLLIDDVFRFIDNEMRD